MNFRSFLFSCFKLSLGLGLAAACQKPAPPSGATLETKPTPPPSTQPKTPPSKSAEPPPSSTGPSPLKIAGPTELKVQVEGVADTPNVYAVDLMWASSGESPLAWEILRTNDQGETITLTRLDRLATSYRDLSAPPGSSYTYTLTIAEETGRHTVASRSVEIPRDLAIQGLVKISDLTEQKKIPEVRGAEPVRFGRIFFRKDSALLIEGGELRLEATRVYADHGKVETFPLDQKAPPEQNGRSGGIFVLKTQEVVGTLEVNARGENGGEGLRGSRGVPGVQGNAGEPASFGKIEETVQKPPGDLIFAGIVEDPSPTERPWSDPVPKTLYKLTPHFYRGENYWNHAKLPEGAGQKHEEIILKYRSGKYRRADIAKIFACFENATHGGRGGTGGPGGPGGPGGTGGDTGRFWISVASSSSGKLVVNQDPGRGGAGGLGGPGGPGGEGGAPGKQDLLELCEPAKPGDRGSEGPTGSTGPEGRSGRGFQVCLHQGTKTTGDCGGFIQP